MLYPLGPRPCSHAGFRRSHGPSPLTERTTLLPSPQMMANGSSDASRVTLSLYQPIGGCCSHGNNWHNTRKIWPIHIVSRILVARIKSSCGTSNWFRKNNGFFSAMIMVSSPSPRAMIWHNALAYSNHKGLSMRVFFLEFRPSQDFVTMRGLTPYSACAVHLR